MAKSSVWAKRFRTTRNYSFFLAIIGAHLSNKMWRMISTSGKAVVLIGNGTKNWYIRYIGHIGLKLLGQSCGSSLLQKSLSQNHCDPIYSNPFSVCFNKVLKHGKPGPYLFISVLFKHKFYRKNCKLHRDLNSDLWHWREARWPLDHNNGPGLIRLFNFFWGSFYASLLGSIDNSRICCNGCGRVYFLCIVTLVGTTTWIN